MNHWGNLHKLVFICGIWFLYPCSSALAQKSPSEFKTGSEKDTMPTLLTEALPELGDSFFRALLTGDFIKLIPYTPSYKHLRSTFDTMDLEFSHFQVLAKREFILRNMHKQYSRLKKNLKKQGMDFKFVSRDSMTWETSQTGEGYVYARVYYLCHRKRKQFRISFLAIRLKENWFFGDELMLEPLP